MGSEQVRDGSVSANIRALFLICGVVASGASLLVAWQWGITTAAPHHATVPLIAAADWPAKRIPEDRGGVGVPFVDLEFYQSFSSGVTNTWQQPTAIDSPEIDRGASLPAIQPPIANPRNTAPARPNVRSVVVPVPRPNRE